ncbi:hypothetical protein ABGB12_05925 [Actinocorallia sp. B10E7]|uniref:hypothetical protein n=1 Tax=Actinocorallia sp. B10E7 TaxID=3153558 RepID=UPI00325F6594
MAAGGRAHASAVCLGLACSVLPFGVAGSVLLVLLVEWRAPDVIPFEWGTFWTVQERPWPAFLGSLGLVWPVLAFGFLRSVLGIPAARRMRWQLDRLPPGSVVETLSPAAVVFRSTLEEVLDRWLIFYAAIAGATFADFLLLGFADLHPVRWFFEDLLIPAADFATWHRLRELLTDHSWTVGAGILASNARFRNSHGYQGLVGFIWSWYLGMFLFLVVFEYGLPLAIAVHIAYNLVIVALHRATVGDFPHIVYLPGEPSGPEDISIR